MSNPKTQTILIVAGAALLGALLTGGVLTTRSDPQDESQLPLPEFMGHVMQRNAEQLWTWTALEVDRNGEHWSKPVSGEDWEEAESDALTLQQLTYTLEHSNYRIDDPRWDSHLLALRTATAASARAAETKDFGGLVKAGEAINDRCVACHLTFAPQLEVKPPPVPLPAQ